jgi:hypothetical protein
MRSVTSNAQEHFGFRVEERREAQRTVLGGLRYGFRTGCGSEHQEMACEKSMPPKATTRTPTASARYGHHTRIRVSSDHQWRCGSVIVQFSNFATGARPKPRCAGRSQFSPTMPRSTRDVSTTKAAVPERHYAKACLVAQRAFARRVTRFRSWWSERVRHRRRAIAERRWPPTRSPS